MKITITIDTAPKGGAYLTEDEYATWLRMQRRKEQIRIRNDADEESWAKNWPSIVEAWSNGGRAGKKPRRKWVKLQGGVRSNRQ
jgi:hypothetical protein